MTKSPAPTDSAKVEDTGEPVALPKDVLDALRFYAHGHHYNIDDDHQQFDTVSGEPANWMFSEKDDDCTMFEDGGIARAVLTGCSAGFEEPVDPVEGEVFCAAPTPSTQAVGEPWQVGDDTSSVQISRDGSTHNWGCKCDGCVPTTGGAPEPLVFDDWFDKVYMPTRLERDRVAERHAAVAGWIAAHEHWGNPASPAASVLMTWHSPFEKPESISPAHPVQVLAVIDDPLHRINGDDPFVDIAAYWPALDKWTITSQCRADEEVTDTLVNVAFWMPLPAAPIKREMFLLAASMGGDKS